MARYSSYAPEHGEFFADVTPERVEAMQTMVRMGLLRQSALDIALHENRIPKDAIRRAWQSADSPAYFEQRFEFHRP
mgnify:FL=1